ncbi:MAG: prepilin peptidase [Desulfurivibrionaceae bacterium]|nr:prepilin peptidase [Desulfurivibrionaceae bacterium]
MRKQGGHWQQVPHYLFGLSAVGLALYFLLAHPREPVIFFASLFFLVICTTDTILSKIPNLATLVLVLVGFGYHLLSGGLPGGATALAGMLTGLALLLLPYLLGGMGAGDVKALAALGCLLGPVDIVQVFLFTGLIGGAMALVHLAVSPHLKSRLRSWLAAASQVIRGLGLPRREAGAAESRIKYPYGSAIAFGFFTFVNWGGLL